MSTGLVGITPAIGLSAHWLAGCHQRPGCRGNRPLSPPVLVLHLAALHSLLRPHAPTVALIFFHSKGKDLANFLMHASICVCICVCGCAWLYERVCVFVCVSVTACLCHAGWPLSPLVMDYDANLLQQLTTSLSLLSWKNRREEELFYIHPSFSVSSIFSTLFFLLLPIFVSFSPSVFPPFFSIHHFHSFLCNALLPPVHFFLPSISLFAPSCLLLPFIVSFHTSLPPVSISLIFHYLSTFPYTPILSPSATLLHLIFLLIFPFLLLNTCFLSSHL